METEGFDQGEEPTEGIDGSPLLPETPEALPLTQKQAAAPQLAEGEEAVDPELQKLMRPGETPTQAYDRLWREQRGRASRQGQELKEMRAALERQQAMLEPILREQYRRAQMEQTRRVAESIPDRDTQPAEYAAYMAEQSYRLQLEQMQAQEAQQQENARLEDLVAVDETWYGEIAAGLQDPAFKQAYDGLTNFSYQAARHDFPDASEEQLLELIELTQAIQARQWVVSGMSVQDAIKSRFAMIQQVFGGQGQQPPAPVPKAGQGKASPTAQRVQRQAARAGAARTVSGPVQSRPAPEPGKLDPGAFASEEDYVKAALDGHFDPSRRAQQKFGVPVE